MATAVSKKLSVVVTGAFILAFYLIGKDSESGNMGKLVGLDFEVFGNVQGVFFRKYTQKKAEELRLKGWCMNTKQDTVVGRIEGETLKIEEMKDWLRRTGSPQSTIEKVEFKNEKEISETSFSNFSIIRR